MAEGYQALPPKRVFSALMHPRQRAEKVIHLKRHRPLPCVDGVVAKLFRQLHRRRRNEALRPLGGDHE